jgi:hypothetical protein
VYGKVHPGLENQDYGRRGSAALTMRHPLYPQKLALTSPTSGVRSVGIVCSQTQATELVSYRKVYNLIMAVIRVFVNDHQIFIIFYVQRSATNHLPLCRTVVTLCIARVGVT